jgi:hypothetical protein
MWLYAADVVRLGKSTPTNAREKTSNVSPAGCTEPWLSSMAQKSAYLGRVTLISRRSASPFLTASQSYLAYDLVDTLTVPIPTMS